MRRQASEGTLDWDAPNTYPCDAESFDMLWADAMAMLAEHEPQYAVERAVGADASYALPLRRVTPRAIHALFTLNMFPPRPADLERSIYTKANVRLA